MGFPFGRRTIHDYTPASVDEAVLTRALVAAQEAPCHKLTWPWRFTRVGPETRAALVEVAVRCKSANRVLSEVQLARLHARMENPAALLVVSQVRCADPFRSREDYAAVACAVQNLCLALHADGVGTKWSTGGVTRHTDTYALCGIDPELEEIVGFVWIGEPACVPEAPVRPPLADVVRQVR